MTKGTSGAGNDQRAEFYSALGEAVSTWAYIEDKLFEIVKARLGAPDIQAAIVFGRTPQISAHIALAAELLIATLPPGHASLREWKRLTGAFEKVLPIRNMMVHQPVHFGGTATVSLQTNPDGTQSAIVTGREAPDFAFGLSEVARVRQRPKLPLALRLGDIESHLATIRQLNLDLLTFQRSLPPL